MLTRGACLNFSARHAVDATARWDQRHQLLVCMTHFLFVPFSLTLHFSLPLVLQNSVGLSNTLSRLLAACNSVSYLAFSFFGLTLIERAGRRKMMMWGAAGQCVCYIFIAALLSQSEDPVNGSKFGAGATAFFFLYYVFFGVCWQVSCSFGCINNHPNLENCHLTGSSLAIPNRNQ